MSSIVRDVLTKCIQLLAYLPRKLLRLFYKMLVSIKNDPRKLLGLICLIAMVTVCQYLVFKANQKRHQLLLAKRNSSEYQTLVAHLISDA